MAILITLSMKAALTFFFDDHIAGSGHRLIIFREKFSWKHRGTVNRTSISFTKKHQINNV